MLFCLTKMMLGFERGKTTILFGFVVMQWAIVSLAKIMCPFCFSQLQVCLSTVDIGHIYMYVYCPAYIHTSSCCSCELHVCTVNSTHVSVYVFSNALSLLLFNGVQRPMGLLALLDEESRFPRATDFSLAGRLALFSTLLLCLSPAVLLICMCYIVHLSRQVSSKLRDIAILQQAQGWWAYVYNPTLCWTCKSLFYIHCSVI